jgi:hypothetical protein
MVAGADRHDAAEIIHALHAVGGARWLVLTFRGRTRRVEDAMISKT